MHQTSTKAPLVGVTPAIILLLGAVVVLLTVLGHGWLRLGFLGQSGVGPMGVASCSETGECTNVMWSAVGISGVVSILGMLTLITGVCAVGVSLACGGLVLARRITDVPHRIARLVLACGIVIAVAWQIVLATSKEVAALDYLEMASLGPAGILCIVTMIVGFVCVHRLAVHARRRPAAQIQVSVAPTPPAAIDAHTHPCYACSRPLVFVAQYQSWFCEGCQHYIPTERPAANAAVTQARG